MREILATFLGPAVPIALIMRVSRSGDSSLALSMDLAWDV